MIKIKKKDINIFTEATFYIRKVSSIYNCLFLLFPPITYTLTLYSESKNKQKNIVDHVYCLTVLFKKKYVNLTYN